MTDRRAALVDTCDDPDCAFCRVGVQVIEALRQAASDTSTEVLTLVRVLAATLVATSRHAEDRAEMLDAIIGQLRDDVALLSSAKETH